MKKEYLECGKIVSTHGVYGELKVQPWTDSPQQFTELLSLYFDRGVRKVSVQRARMQKNMILLKIEGVDTIEDAVKFRDQVLYAHRDDIALEEGEVFVQDLIGCTVRDVDTGADYGKIYDVRATGANDVYYLRDAAGVERLVPAIDDVVIQKDVENELVLIRPLEGLFDA